MGNKIKLNAIESIRSLKRSLEGLTPKLKKEFDKSVAELAKAAHAQIISHAQSKLKGSKEDYLKAVRFEQLSPTEFAISLEGDWANMLEEGFPAYDLSAKLLRSNSSVKSGPNSGDSWVKTSKEGNKYAKVPFQRSESMSAKGASLGEALQQMTAQNSRGRKQRITELFTDPAGNALEGKVAVGTSDNPMFDRLVKYQERTTEGDLRSVYVNYRTVSSAGKKWVHPGYLGVHAFEEAEKQIEKELNKIISQFLG